jgi:hypothetical protein
MAELMKCAAKRVRNVDKVDRSVGRDAAMEEQPSS